MPEPLQPSPSHDHRNQCHPCFFQDLLISQVSQQAHPIAHHTILMSVVAIHFSSLTDIGHVSQLYSNIGRITVWYIRSFIFVPSDDVNWSSSWSIWCCTPFKYLFHLMTMYIGQVLAVRRHVSVSSTVWRLTIFGQV